MVLCNISKLRSRWLFDSSVYVMHDYYSFKFTSFTSLSCCRFTNYHQIAFMPHILVVMISLVLPLTLRLGIYGLSFYLRGVCFLLTVKYAFTTSSIKMLNGIFWQYMQNIFNIVVNSMHYFDKILHNFYVQQDCCDL